jgi:uncharacterized protein (DUF433 family)
MQLEDYFEFESFETKFGPTERIRIKGHRIPIECVIEAFHNGASPDAIVRELYPSLNLEKVFATLTYYLHNRERVDDYIRRSEEIGEKRYEEWAAQEPSPVVKRIQELKAQMQSRK